MLTRDSTAFRPGRARTVAGVVVLLAVSTLAHATGTPEDIYTSEKDGGCQAAIATEEGYPAFAQWRSNGEIVPDRPWAKSKGDFGAMLAFTDKPNEVFAAWAQPTRGVWLQETDTTVRGVPMVGLIVFTGCSPNASRHCDLVGRFTTFSPDGPENGEHSKGNIWVDLPPPPDGSLELCHNCPGIAIGPDAPLGVYTVRAEVTDRVAGKTLVLERSFTVVETKTPP